MILSLVVLAAVIVSSIITFNLVQKTREEIMSVREELVALAAQLNKVYDEVAGLPAVIADLEAVIAAGTITSEDLAPLREVAQRLDDIVPDAVVEPEPEPEVPSEPEVPVEPEPEPELPVDPETEV